MAPLQFEILTAERRVYSDEVDMVVAPGQLGELGILPNHAPLLTPLFSPVNCVSKREARR